jgi:glycosyltransferase involved in cell wall biosynthesis
MARIGISLYTLVPGVVGGSETYARDLVDALERVGELEYDVIPPAEGGPSKAARLARMARMAAARRPLGFGAIHYPLTVPLPRTDAPAAVTLHDLQHHFLPENFSRAERAYRAVVYDRAARRAQVVVTPTEYVAGTVVERLDVPRVRVRALAHGLDHERFRPAERTREPFLLYPANRWPHKNHGRLFEALALVRRERPQLRLVLTGSRHEGKPAPDGVDVRGRVSPDELVELYRTAATLVFPSLYEGFGAPPLEAMACGCPVAASNVTAVPEVCGEAARLFDPLSPEAIAEAVEDVLGNPEPWRARGLERARGFSWERTAREHEAVYRELAADAPRARGARA